MSIRLRYCAIALAFQLTVACGDGTATAPIKNSATSSPPSPAPAVIALAISPGDMELSLGGGTMLAAVQVMSDGTLVPIRASWASLNNAVVTINGANGYAVAVGPGQARIRADAGGLIAYATLNVLDAKGTGTPEELIVESFSIIEFQYSPTGGWEYAPQLRVRAVSGHTLTVLLVKFSITGFLGATPIGCGATVGSVPRELNGEVYGDWAFTISSPGNRASGADATAVITFVDETGATATLTVRGPVVPGTLPTTYGSGNTGACFHGYGSTG